MNLESQFIYRVDLGVASYVIIAQNKAAAASVVNSIPEHINITKLGCVTADVQDKVKPGIVISEWHQ